ncbi:FtsK/SpoIIIE domain-containing protein [Phosphitispora fastidiosa]|uniref:FtsK/SpoIIIE domain-containing protein n=1 Tax=Phosphitispora fastidiosa TaxID=2837202 RepID=UPI001E39DCB6|nr:FtsK/SpoIIIE domain-containing protein [Phosphitispora fastidiosa]MBU7006287.1 S-DNA-T family DNA segregation ATPase FtsK/SpoIIIE [Phosphitispora fastidiosa]
MPKKQEPVLDLKMLKYHWWRYVPTFKDHDIPIKVLETFDNLGFITKDHRKPVIINRKKTEYGWHLVVRLPPGISFQSVLRKKNYFSDAVNSFIVMTFDGVLQMDIQVNNLPSKIPYKALEPPKMLLPIPIGYTPKGVEWLDLADAPHMLVAGESGFGKSNFLHQAILSLLPFARIFIIDPKQLDFGYLSKHVVLAEEDEQIYNLLEGLNKEHDRRVKILKKAGCVKIQQYEGGDMPLIIIVIDELAEIRDKDTHVMLHRLLRMSRAVGLHIVTGTQRPSVKAFGEAAGDARMLYSARLCYLVPSEIDSRMVLGEENSMAAWLPAIKGRGIFKFGMKLSEVQTMYLPIEKAKKIVNNMEARRWDIEPCAKRLLPG